MGEEQFQSAAFRTAELRSQRLRIFGVLGFVAGFIGVTIVRVFVIRTASGSSPWVWSLLLAAAIAAYAGWTLRQVEVALKANSSLPSRFWILSTIAETSIPACALASLVSSQIQSVYRALASPSILVFFLFIILSTIRLSRSPPILGVRVTAISNGTRQQDDLTAVIIKRL